MEVYKIPEYFSRRRDYVQRLCHLYVLALAFTSGILPLVPVCIIPILHIFR